MRYEFEASKREYSKIVDFCSHSATVAIRALLSSPSDSLLKNIRMLSISAVASSASKLLTVMVKPVLSSRTEANKLD